MSQEIGKREAILGAALEIFARHGYHGAPVPPIADQAGVGVGTLYRYFKDKEALVNEVFRHSKRALGEALMTDLDRTLPPQDLFAEFWRRLIEFARRQPLAFQFLEMQDHLNYLDAESKQVEVDVLAPIMTALIAHQKIGVLKNPLHVAPMIAMIWGGVVGMFKYERAGYFKLTAADLDAARDAIWNALTTANKS